MRLLQILACFVAAIPADIVASGFTEVPKRTPVRGGSVISFSARSACDVEVAVLDASGNVVRHRELPQGFGKPRGHTALANPVAPIKG